MDHFYQKIHGWFSFSKLYTKIVKKYDQAIFVEVGTWKGRSAAFMAVEIANSNKNIKFYCVDTWCGSEEHLHELSVKKNELYELFLSNIEPVKDFIIPIKKSSFDAAAAFLDKSIDFVFIDASHDYENVKLDLNTWYPKIKKGGTFGGHDYHYQNWPGVIQAVDEFCEINKLNKIVEDDYWFINL